MIKATDLKATNVQNFYFYNDANDTLDTVAIVLKGLIESRSQLIGLPISIYMDEIKCGGFFTGSKDPCLVIYNTEHQYDYFAYVLALKAQRNHIIVEIWNYGTSKQFLNEMKGGNRGIGGMLKNAVLGSKEKWLEEQNYYEHLIEVIASIFN